jgi:di/tricarboxylate transporter
MGSQQALMLGVFLLLVFGLCLKRMAVAKLFAGAALVVYTAGIVSTDELLNKASSPVLVTLVLIMLISVGLERFSWIKRISNFLVGPNFSFSLLRLSIVTALTSSLLNNTAVVATLMHSIRVNPYHAASRLLIPLSYMAILGGTMTLVGTSTNLIIAALYADASGSALAFFDFLPVGAALTVAGIGVILLFARFLPQRFEREVEIQEYLVEAEVKADSALIGKSVLENGLRDLKGLFLVEIVRGDHLLSPVGPQELIESGDKLIFSGDIQQVETISALPGVTLYAAKEGLLRQNMIEVIVLPNAVIEGKTIKESGFRALFDAAVVGIRRGGKRLSGQLGQIVIKAGDSLILAVGSDFEQRQNLSKNFAVLAEQTQRQQRVPAWKELAVGGAFLLSILGASIGVMPLIKGLLLTLALMAVLKVVQISELRRRFPFELWIIITAALVVSQGMLNTGLTALVSDWLGSGMNGYSPFAALAGVYVFTVVLTELVTNNAAAALAFPLAWALAESLGVSVLPFTMAVAYGASASFLTPYGYATNLMVQNVGRYSLLDYTRVGVPMTVAYGVLILILVPALFPF